jgi:hypothetical protein
LFAAKYQSGQHNDASLHSSDFSAAALAEYEDVKCAGKFMNTADVMSVVTVLVNFQIQIALDL